jgi:hypothetical protein
MKRCPNCGNTYTNDLQKFCTRDGIALVDTQIPSAGQGETIRIDSAKLDSAQLDDDLPTKMISRELPSTAPAEFDPYKTVISPPQKTSAGLPRDTQDLTPPSTPPPISPALPPSPSGPIQAPPSPSSGALPPGPSGPIQTPPPSSTPAASGPISTSAPLPPSQPLVPPAQTATAPRPAKKSKLPLVLGILAVLFALGAGALGATYWFVVRPMLAAKRTVIAEPTPGPASTPIVKSTPDTTENKEAPPYSPPADAVQFVNSVDNLDGKLKEHYVDFSFYYPNNWQKDPKAGVPGASNFAKVERSLPPEATQENFAVGWYSSAGSEEGDRAVFHTLAENLSAQYQKNFPEYQKVSEGPTRVGVYDGYQFRFESVSRSTDKGDIKIWGRVIFLPPVDGGKNGVTLLMLATSLAPELKSVNDVGVKGELPMILASFRFGKQ